jgi:hypothetical protein
MTGMELEKVFFSILGRKGGCELVGFQNQT